MSKSELKRLCAQNPVEMAERIVELEQRVKVLTDALEEIANSACGEASHQYIAICALDSTPQQTAEQIERWHVEWMMKLPSYGCFTWDAQGGWVQTSILDKGMAGVVELVAIPQLPETKE